MIKRNHVRHFLALIDAGNFTHAAARLGVAQPTLSASIAELERMAGARLLVRERKQIRLTQAGNSLAAHARAIEREFRAAEANFGDGPTKSTPLKIGVLSSIATNYLTEIVRHMRDGNEIALVEGNDAELRRRLGIGQVDVILTTLRSEDADRPSLAIFKEGYRLMVSADHALAKATALDAREVASETMIARRSCEILSETSRWFTQRGVRPPFFLRSTNDDRCLEIVKAGMGVTTGPESLARHGVAAIPLIEYDFRRTIGLLTDRDRSKLLDPQHPLVQACTSAKKS